MDLGEFNKFLAGFPIESEQQPPVTATETTLPDLDAQILALQKQKEDREKRQREMEERKAIQTIQIHSPGVAGEPIHNVLTEIKNVLVDLRQHLETLLEREIHNTSYVYRTVKELKDIVKDHSLGVYLDIKPGVAPKGKNVTSRNMVTTGELTLSREAGDVKMSVLPRGASKPAKIVYPVGCKEVTDELGKDELVRRLKLIARAFQDMGQDENEQYAGLALHLASDFFVDHQSKDVRLLVACCIADVFRIFAPEPPFQDAAHLKEIFVFLIKQLRGLEDPNSPTFKRYFYLLENLAWVKSFNICIELADNQEIFCDLFQLMFSIVSDKHSSKVKNFMLDMMCPLITEADLVSQELLDVILINIVEPHKTQNRCAYHLAKELLVKTSNAIEPYVQAFFNNTLMLGKTSESDLSGHLYDLIYELNNICPSVLLAVLPQLEFKLKSNEETERKHVTKVLAKMFSEPGSTLAEQNKPLWNCFLGRFNDISITVRTICVTAAQYFILYHPELMKDVLEQLKVRQHDPEETVRSEVVSTLLSVAKKDFGVMTEDLLAFIKERTRDKKFKIRREALLGLGQLYKQITSNEEVDKAQLDKIVWVKDKVFHAYYQNNCDDRLLVERIFNSCLVPYSLPNSERMKRLFLMYTTLDDHAVRAFGEMLKFRNNVRVLVSKLIELQDTQASNPSSQVIFNPSLAAIARTLPEPQKSLDSLKKFNHILLEDKRLRSHLKLLVSPQCTCKKAHETVKEILKKLGGSNASQQNMLYTNVKYLMERVAPVMFDEASVDLLVKHIDDTVRGLGLMTEGIDGAGEKGAKLLMCISSVFPYFFKSEQTFETLLTFLKDEDEAVADTTLQIFTNTGAILQVHYPSLYSALLPVLQSTAKIGNPNQSKHAIRCINAVCGNKEAVFSQVFEHAKNHLNPESAHYITSIVALGHIAMLCPQEFSSGMKAIVSKLIVKDLLMQDRTSGEPTTESWYADHMVTEETQAKIQAMKLLVRWLLGQKSNVNNSGTSTLRLLYTVIVHEGDLMEKGMINKPELARLRLQAGCCMLKLAEEPIYAELITSEQFQVLALLINDACYHVRLKFAVKLHKGLLSMKLPLEYMSIFSLAANDPTRERHRSIKQFLQANISKRREYIKQNPSLGAKMFLYLPDYVMPYTIHLLAHDPDLKSFDHIEALKNIKECLWFIMDPLVSRSDDYNYQFFRRLIENIKQTKDTQGPEDEDMNKKLYAVCDIALGLLQKNCTNVVLKDSNVAPMLPNKLFTKIDKSILNTHVYLPKDFNFEGRFQRRAALSTVEVKPGPQRSTQPVTEEIVVVESPGPVVNPNPVTPREQRYKPMRSSRVKSETEVKGESSQENIGDESEKKPIKRGARKASKKEENTLSSPGSGFDFDDSEDSAPPPPKRGRQVKKVREEMSASPEQTESESQGSEDVVPAPKKGGRKVNVKKVKEGTPVSPEQMETESEESKSESKTDDSASSQESTPGPKKKTKTKADNPKTADSAQSKTSGKTGKQQESNSSKNKSVPGGKGNKSVTKTGSKEIAGKQKSVVKKGAQQQGQKGTPQKVLKKNIANSSAKSPASRTKQPSSESGSSQGDSARKRSRSTSSEESSPVKKQRIVGKQKIAVKNLDSESSDTSDKSEKSASRTSSRSPSKSPSKSPLRSPSKSPMKASQGSTSSTGFKSPSSPAPRGTPKKKTILQIRVSPKKGKVTRGVLRDGSSSPARSSDSELVPSPGKKVTPKKVLTPKKKQPLQKATLQAKNVRRAKTLTNGTSDGEDTEETDSSTSPSKAAARKSAALKKAIQKVGLQKDTIKKKLKTRKK